jgi:hypothetical protein
MGHTRGERPHFCDSLRETELLLYFTQHVSILNQAFFQFMIEAR